MGHTETKTIEVGISPDLERHQPEDPDDARGVSVLRTLVYPGHVIRRKRLAPFTVRDALTQLARLTLEADGCDTKDAILKFSIDPVTADVTLQVVAHLARTSRLHSAPIIEARHIDQLLKKAVPKSV